MSHTFKKVLLALFGLIFAVASLSAQDYKRGHFTISAFGGSFGGVGFVGGYQGNPIGLPNDLILPGYDEAEKDVLYHRPKAPLFGFSLGYSYSLAEPEEEWSFLSMYAEFSYCPSVKFKDATETLSRVDWSQSQFSFVDVVSNYPQTGRKAGMSGIMLGIVCIPFQTFPIGVDIGFGWWGFRQEYVSGTLKAFQGKADISTVYSESSGMGLSYAGDGKLERNHGALAFKIGLTYKLLKFLWLDASFRSLSYFDSHGTNWYYVDSGETVNRTEGHALGRLFSLGIKVTI